MLTHNLVDMKKARILSIRQNPNWEVLKNVVYSDEAARKHLFNPQEHETKMNKVEDISKRFGEKQAFEKRMATFVDGRMIMTLLPKIKGINIGIIKDKTRDWIITNDFNVTKEEVVNYIQTLGRELGY